MRKNKQLNSAVSRVNFDSARNQFHFRLDNVPAGDAIFLGELLALFADPHRKTELDGLRAGSHGIYRDPVTHRAIVSDLFQSPARRAA
ncbi:MAG: hypothetical protein SFY81_04820 [Verrucomicrobiota bacterium]|nr:hypothetical protein [Verrucomicrobiota bacterium]